jgi:hypothetical protein
MAPIRVDGGLPSVDHGNSGPFWAEPKDERATATIGASSSLPRVPAKVFLLNPQPALSLDGGNRSLCPHSSHSSPPVAAVAFGLESQEIAD